MLLERRAGTLALPAPSAREWLVLRALSLASSFLSMARGDANYFFFFCLGGLAGGDRESWLGMEGEYGSC